MYKDRHSREIERLIDLLTSQLKYIEDISIVQLLQHMGNDSLTTNV